jgi:thioredoxin
MNKTVALLMVLTITAALNAFSIEPLVKEAQNANEPLAKKMTKADFLTKVMDYQKNTQEWVYLGPKPCIIDFYADWCGPCRITSPILEELAKEYEGKIDFYKVNVDYEKELASVFGISGIPAFLYCPMDGKPSMTSGIARDKEQTKQMFKDNIEKLLLKKATE